MVVTPVLIYAMMMMEMEAMYLDLTRAISEWITRHVWYLQVMPILIAVIRWKSIPAYTVYIAGIFSIWLVRDILQTNLSAILYNNLWVSNCAEVVILPLFLLFFLNLGMKSRKLMLLILSLFTFALTFAIINTFYIGSILVYKKLVFSANSILFITCSLIYLFDFALYSKMDKPNFPVPIIQIFAIILFFSISIGVYYINVEFGRQVKFLWNMRSFMLVIFCLITSFVIFKSRTQEND